MSQGTGTDHKGQPSGTNKNEGTGNVISKDDQQKKEITEKYMDGEDETGQSSNEKHPNRNTDKDDPTRAGGYKN